MAERQMNVSLQKSNQALRKLTDQLTCPVCLESYRDPKLLECHHVFCLNCLENLLPKTHRPTSLVITCPTCRQDTTVPEGNVASLQSAFHIHSLFDIQDTLLDRTPQQLSTSSLQPSAGSSSCPKSDHCSTHHDRLLEMYCETCEIPICCACIVHCHKSHTFSLMADAFPKQNETVSLHCKLLEQQLQALKSVLEKTSLEGEHVRKKQRALEETIQLTFRQFHKMLDSRQAELSKELEHYTQQKLDCILARENALEQVECESTKQLESVQLALQTGNEVEILAMKKPLIENLENVAAEICKISSTPSLEPNLNFIAAQNDIETLSTIGKLYTQVAHAKNCGVRDLSASIELGDTVTSVLDVRDQCGAKMDGPSVNIECGIHPTASRSTSISKSSIGKYKISCQPSSRGHNKLEISVNGESIPGSPFVVHVRPPITIYRYPIHCMKGLHSPWGVAVNSNGHVIVAEKNSHRLVYFSQETEKILHTVGKKTLLQNQFQQPAALCVDNENMLYLTEMHTFNIKKCNMNGDVIKSIGSPGRSPLKFMSPMGIGFNSKNGKVYVADMENHRIQVLNSDLTFHSIITGSCDGKHTIRLPSDIAFDSNGTMYVTDNENHCIQVYTLTGEHVQNIGRKGKKEGQLGLPFGICIDDREHVYVTEMYNNRVSIFSTSGQFLSCFGSCGTGLGQFEKPHRIALDRAGYLYVTDNGNNRLQVF